MSFTSAAPLRYPQGEGFGGPPRASAPKGMVATRHFREARRAGRPRPAAGFPSRGSWHGEAVTDEVDHYVRAESYSTSSGSLRSPPSPQGEGFGERIKKAPSGFGRRFRFAFDYFPRGAPQPEQKAPEPSILLPQFGQNFGAAAGAGA